MQKSYLKRCMVFKGGCEGHGVGAAAHLSDTQPCHRCHNINIALACHSTLHTQATAIRRCKWILTHNLALIIPSFSYCRSDHLDGNIHGDVCLHDLYMEVYILEFLTFDTGRSVSPFLSQFHVVRHFIRNLCWLLSKLWLAAAALLRIGLALSFSHATCSSSTAK